ncbi:hypothetical protein ACNR90_001571 [Candidozyma auris]
MGCWGCCVELVEGLLELVYVHIYVDVPVDVPVYDSVDVPVHDVLSPGTLVQLTGSGEWCLFWGLGDNGVSEDQLVRLQGRQQDSARTPAPPVPPPWLAPLSLRDA